MKIRAIYLVAAALAVMSGCEYDATVSSQAPVEATVYRFTDRTCGDGPWVRHIRFESAAAKEVYVTSREFGFERGHYTLEPEPDHTRSADKIYFLNSAGEPRWRDAER